MSEISFNLLWCVVQVTIVCASASLLTLILSRWNRIPVVGMLQVSLALVFLLTLLSLSPWPRWGSTSRNRVSVVQSDPVPGELLTQSQELAESHAAISAHSRRPQPASWTQPWQSSWSTLAACMNYLSRIGLPWLLPLLAVSLFIGGVRFLAGWNEIRRLRKTSTPLADHRCNEMFLDLKHKLALMHVDLRVHRDIPTPATMGWRRPVILLPDGSRSWTNDELRSVLAHELAHVARHDFRTLALAQVAALLHFYHPLVHSLVSSLRLEQEMAADAAAAKLAGGHKRYMASLASLALRMDSRSAAWPLRCFLPTSGAFIWRIEMLKNPSPAVRSNYRLIGVASALPILAIGLLTAGFRPQAVLAQDDQRQAASAVDAKNHPASAVDAKDAESARTKSMDNAKKIALAMHNYYDKHGSFPPAVIVGPNGVKHSWRVAILPQLGYSNAHGKYNFEKPWDSPENKKLLDMIPDVYLAPGAAGDSSDTSWFAVVGEGTAFDSDKGRKFEEFTDGTVNTLLVVESKLSVPWTQPKDIEYVEDKPLPKLGGIHNGGFVSAFVDGAAHFITDKVDEKVIRNILQRADGNLVPYEELHPERQPGERE